MKYDKTSSLDIERYAKKLIGKTFYDVLKSYFKNDDVKIVKTINKNKGKLGNIIEEFYFGYKQNSKSEADFSEAGTELKVTPYIKSKKGDLKAKERLVIGMIPNNKPIEKEFEKSHVLKKMKLMLLILYYHDKKITNKLNYSIDYVKLFSILGKACEKDLEVIKNDYKYIVNKIVSGKSHELSEGDTNYLSACTKGRTSEKSLQKQYYSDIPAKRRAFSLKQSYMTYVFNTYIVKNIETYESVLKNDVKIQEIETVVLNKINRFKGKKVEDLYKKFELEKSNAKQKNNILVCKMLDINTENVEEFENTLIYKYFSETKFLFVIFYESEKGIFELVGAKFWNMPIQELEGICQKEWINYRDKFKKGVNFEIKNQKNGKIVIENDLPKKSETSILHLRPRANKSKYIIRGIEYGNGKKSDTDELLNGDRMTKQCFWLNNEYISNLVKDEIKGER